MAVFVIASIVSYVDRVALSLLIDPMRAELGLSEVQMGLLQGTAFALLYAFAGLPLGRLADRHSRRNLLLFGVTLWSAATALGGFAPDFGWLFASRVLVGIGEASLVPAAVSMIADLHAPDRRGRAIAVFMMGQSVGGGASVAFVGYVMGFVAAGAFASLPVIGVLSSWRVVLVLCGMLGLVVIALLCTIREPARTGVKLRASSPRLERQAALAYITERKRLFIPLYVGYALLALGTYGLIAWTPSLLMRRFAFSPSETGALFGTVTAVSQFCGVLGGGLLLGWLERRGSGMHKLAAARWTALCCLPAALVALATSGVAAAALLAFWFAAASMTNTLLFTANLDLYPNNMRGTATALNTLLSTLVGASLGPLLIAYVTQYVLDDPARVGLSISIVLAPALLAAVALIGHASRALRSRLESDAELRSVIGLDASSQGSEATPGNTPMTATQPLASAPVIR
jgi:MFS family permease